MTNPALRMPTVGLILIVAGSPLLAQPVDHWSHDWDSPRLASYHGDGSDPREGRVSASRFVIKDARAASLGHGSIEIKAGAGDTSDLGERNAFQAALTDQLIAKGYVTNTPTGTGQVAEMVVEHRRVTPDEPPHKPVSGEVNMGVSNRGTFGGMAIAIDLTKPRQGLVSTRLQVRIRDASDNAVLWEGHAEIVTREGDRKWSSDLIAQKLAAALFKGFPAAD